MVPMSHIIILVVAEDCGSEGGPRAAIFWTLFGWQWRPKWRQYPRHLSGGLWEGGAALVSPHGRPLFVAIVF